MQVVEGMKKLTVGMPWDDAAIVPVVSSASADLVEALIMDAKAKGATLCQVGGLDRPQHTCKSD
jgi:acyl-CoA reductase-like NAD-dependent aldehyde dehydrogenase